MKKPVLMITSEIANILNFFPRHLKRHTVIQALHEILFIVPVAIIPFASLQHEGKWYDSIVHHWSYRLDPRDINLPSQRVIHFIRTEKTFYQNSFVSWTKEQLVPVNWVSKEEEVRLMDIRKAAISILDENSPIHFNTKRMKELSIEKFFMTNDQTLIIFQLIS